MRREAVDLALALVICVATAATIKRVNAPGAPPETLEVGRSAGLTAIRIDEWTDLEEPADLTVANDPFRISNTPPMQGIARAVSSDRSEGPSALVPLRPRFELQGIAGGPPWRAMVAGFPDQPPLLVAAGTVIGHFTVEQVAPERVIIKGTDSTWTLTLAGQPR